MSRRYALREDQWKRIEHLLPEELAQSALPQTITGSSLRQFCIDIEPVFPGGTCLNASVISAWFTHVSAAGRSPAFGKDYSSIWPQMQTMNTP